MKALQLRLVLHTCKKEAQLSRNYDLTVLARVPKVVWFQQLSRIATQLSRNCDQTVLARIPRIVLVSAIVSIATQLSHNCDQTNPCKNSQDCVDFNNCLALQQNSHHLAQMHCYCLCLCWCLTVRLNESAKTAAAFGAVKNAARDELL